MNWYWLPSAFPPDEPDGESKDDGAVSELGRPVTGGAQARCGLLGRYLTGNDETTCPTGEIA